MFYHLFWRENHEGFIAIQKIYGIVTRDFLEMHFEIIPLDLAVADTAVQLRREHRIRLPDAIIWATARVNGAVLVTRNTKDFNPAWDGIRLPYTL